MIDEVWRSIAGFEGSYDISNLGRVKSLQRVVVRTTGRKYTVRERLLQAHFYGGYLRVRLSMLLEDSQFGVHRLVAIAFIPNPENKPQVNHINGVKTDNMVDNLEWATNQENTSHASRTGLRVAAKGVECGQSKLTPELIDRAKKLIELGHTRVAIARLFGINRSTLHRALIGQNWKHLTK